MATKVTSKRTKSVNNRPNCLKVTKRTQKVNLQTVTTADGKKIKTSAREARSMKKNSKNVSLYEEISYDKEGNKITIMDILKTNDIDYVEDIYKNDNIKLLKEYIKILTPREREIIEDRYGLNGKDEVTQKDIAKKLKISRSYVSRLEKRATTKILREFMKNEQNKR